MLEYDFNDLDNDFITLWSDYILNYDKNKIFSNLVKLAEKGQINAVQSFYILSKGSETNEIIDKIVSNYKSTNMNELFAKSLKAYVEDIKYIETLENKYDKIRKTFEVTRWGNTTEENGQLYDTMGLIELEFKETLYQSFLKAAIISGLKNFKMTNNSLVAQRVLEIQPMSFVKIKINPRKVRNKLIKCCENALKENLKDFDAYKFALAKNLVFFKSGKKMHALGIQMLKELAGRPLLTIKEIKNQEDEKTF